MMAELRMMVGIPGSGKSTIANWWLETGQVDVIVSSDQIREAITGDAGDVSRDADVWVCFYSQIEDALDENLRVVADATHVTPPTWAKILNIATAYNLTPQAHIMRVAHSISAKRNATQDRKVPVDVMMRMAENFDGLCSRKTLYNQGFVVTEYFEEDLPVEA